jgi:uncharacterized protein (TIGR02145 family)
LCEGFVEGTKRLHYERYKEQFCDERDGKKYVYVTIGEGETAQTWMAENLNYRIPDGTSRCCPISGTTNANDNDNDNCVKYGRLYNWNTASSSTSSTEDPSGVQGVCPAGWHLPSRAEWIKLRNYAGDYTIAGAKLKATSDWNWDNDGNKSGNGTDDYGFSALPGSYGNPDFDIVGYRGRWWSATDFTTTIGQITINNANFMEMSIWWGSFDGPSSWSKTSFASVRCVKDGP